MPSFNRKYGVQTTIVFPVPKLNDTDFAASGDWTPAATDIRISKDGGNVADCTNTAAAVGGAGSVLFKLTLTATEMQAAHITLQLVDAAVENQAITIETYGNASAQHAVDFDDAVRMGLTTLPDAAANAAGGLVISVAGGLNMDLMNAAAVRLTAVRAAVLTDLIDGGRLDLILDIIAADTTTDIPALIATAQSDLDIITGATGVNLLSATQTSIDAILTDTGSTLDVKINSIQSNVGTILGKWSGVTLLKHWLGLLGGKQAANATALTELKDSGAGSGTYDPTTDSLEACRDRGDASWLTATGFSTHNAAAVWSSGTRTLTATGLDLVLVSDLSSVPATTAKVTDAIAFLFMGLRNKVDITNTDKEIHRDGGAVLGTKALTDDGATYSEGKMT